MKNKMEDLRNHLFAAIEGLLDEEANFDIAKADAIAKIGQVLVNSAKIEVEFLDKIGGQGTGFISDHKKLLEK